MLSLSIFLKAFGSILILFVACCFIGQIIFYRRRTINGFNVQLVFESVLLGLLLIVSLYAIFQTGFKTILLPVPAVLLLFFSGKRTISTPDSLVSTKSLLIVLVIVSIFYLVYYSQSFIDFNANQLRYSSGDVSFYA